MFIKFKKSATDCDHTPSIYFAALVEYFPYVVPMIITKMNGVFGIVSF
jgi:hypothetical protein